MTTKRWEYIGRANGKAHKYFTEVATGRIALADNSGTLPHQTDDGVLYLDLDTRIAHIGYNEYRVGVLLPDGNKAGTFANRSEVQWICQRWAGLTPHGGA